MCVICFALSVDCVVNQSGSLFDGALSNEKRTAWSRKIHSKVYTQVFEMNPRAGGLHIPK